MSQTFIIKDRFQKELGEISFSENRFKVEVSRKEDQEILEDLLDRFFKRGIRDLGEVILDEAIKPGDPLFLNEVRNQLLRKGYLLVKKQ
ncbi:MAG: hypothetical protein KY055_01755 [Candidatus Nealsonbacteria bacterium]|nr:hypothetical protein [Candidatus Nealsonbacteria bacterium]